LEQGKKFRFHDHFYGKEVVSIVHPYVGQMHGEIMCQDDLLILQLASGNEFNFVPGMSPQMLVEIQLFNFLFKTSVNFLIILGLAY